MILTYNALHELVSQNVVENRNREIVVDTSSICLHLDNQFTEYEPYEGSPITPPHDLPVITRTIAKNDSFILPPGGVVLACSEESVTIPNDKFGLVQTKGSIARGFLTVHMCDGQIDPGYIGKITLELFNASKFYYKLSPGMPIASLFFLQTDTDVKPYNGRYQKASTPTSMKKA